MLEETLRGLASQREEDSFKNRLVSCLRRQEYRCSGENGSQVGRVHTRVRSEGSRGDSSWKILTDTKKGDWTISLVNGDTFSVEFHLGSVFLAFLFACLFLCC